MSGASEADTVLEQIATEMEQGNILDLQGIIAKRKRHREDAELRMRTRQEQRRELAGWIRSFKSEGGNRLHRFLEEVRDGDTGRFDWAPDVAAAILAKLVTVTVHLELATHLRNCEPTFSFALTKQGLARLSPSPSPDTEGGRT